MKTYKIFPLNLGYITRPKKNFFFGYQGTEVEDFPVIAYYLEGEHKILVDNGGCAVDAPRGVAAQPYTRTKEQEIDNALRAIGVEPEEIEFIIFTHICRQPQLLNWAVCLNLRNTGIDTETISCIISFPVQEKHLDSSICIHSG